MCSNKKNNEEIPSQWDGLAISIAIISIIIIGFSFYAPKLFVQPSSNGIIFNNKTGVIGDTIGGIMNPFIALAGVLVTFLAFYIQLKANKQQINNFRTELNNNKEENRLNKFENQFYSMLQLHKQNVNELKFQGDQTDTITGRAVFTALRDRINKMHKLYQGNNTEIKDRVKEYYEVIFDGYKPKETFNMTSTKGCIVEIREHSTHIAHYIRHLYLMVKFVVKQEENFISYEKKREYLRLLRAQMSTDEQIMLFYNWYTDTGSQWENRDNYFLTKYRMIHNIFPNLLIKEVVKDIEEGKLFSVNDKTVKHEKGRMNDPIFELIECKK